MVPYGMALAAVSYIGHSLGAGKPGEARSGVKIVALASLVCSLAIAMVILLFKSVLIELFTDDLSVLATTKECFYLAIAALFFDWLQCCASGAIKGAGYQGLGSVGSLASLGLVAMPLSWALAFRQGWGIKGLWVGYGCSALALTAFFYALLFCWIDWEAIAEAAARDEDSGAKVKTGEGLKKYVTLKTGSRLEEPLIIAELRKTRSSTSSQSELTDDAEYAWV
uniref:Uncharacterized protein n=1 Tax=Favella ehrenbergii TaxID=182087 RepID=A0A7S3I193_9SPIT|mmetsp:Transcript_25120/g.31492  ORF Transcript_25120/g.31492 Transcript_25120/m.31492 type:complete len:224 (+) Transcript_25120:1263-1934(+)|eukprot:CAMPEP_0170461154 /NCGR_PEP_ID=MMETSP0123-20130129/7182_1 /TAXON_ID=182087 /ORGANISM="Favella ehrenbergii, Strain Fehren 1" /LENGTH=223 /DNA_ID=CAMNT_0010726135 /DNA_START=1253 /DNA_END=1924 /DNA_ORIENTATION=-